MCLELLQHPRLEESKKAFKSMSIIYVYVHVIPVFFGFTVVFRFLSTEHSLLSLLFEIERSISQTLRLRDMQKDAFFVKSSVSPEKQKPREDAMGGHL